MAANLANLVRVQGHNNRPDPVIRPQHDSQPFSVCLINPCSVCNKATELCEFITDNSLDVCVITETWLKGDDRDNVILAELKPPGYSVSHVPRKSRGGGLAVIHRDSVPLTPIAPGKYQSFESMECLMKTTPPLRLVSIYRPPPSRTNGHTFKNFMDEIGSYFENLVVSTGMLLIMGDFNIHVDNTGDKEGSDFLALVESLDMTQHVSEATHHSRHTLDLVLTKAQAAVVPSIAVKDHCFPDHFPVFCQLPLHAAKPKAQQVTYRKVKAICPDSFTRDINRSKIASLPTDTSTDNAISLYNSVLTDILDRHAPVKTGFFQYTFNQSGTQTR